MAYTDEKIVLTSDLSDDDLPIKNHLRVLSLVEEPHRGTVMAHRIVEDVPDNKQNELFEVVAFLIQARYNKMHNPTLVLRNPEYFVRIILELLLDKLEFIVNLKNKKEVGKLRQCLIDISSAAPNKPEQIQTLKDLFEKSLTKKQYITLFLPFYKDYCKSYQNNLTQKQKEDFIGQIAFMIESSFVRRIYDPKNPQELIDFGLALRNLRAEHGLWAPLQTKLDEMLVNYQPPQASEETLEIFEKYFINQVYAESCQAYADFELALKKEITALRAYLILFSPHSMYYKELKDAIKDADHELELHKQALKPPFPFYPEDILRRLQETKETTDKIFLPHKQLQSTLLPFKKRVKDLHFIFDKIGRDYTLQRRDHYSQLVTAITKIEAKLERQIFFRKSIDEALKSIDEANKALSDLIAPEIDKEIAHQTPLQKIADSFAKVNDPTIRADLSNALLRLKAEGADITKRTHNHSGRASSFSEVWGNLKTFNHPLLGRSLSAGEIAAKHGASVEIVEELSPRKETPETNPQSTWTRFIPQMSSVRWFMGKHREEEAQKPNGPTPGKIAEILQQSGYSALNTEALATAAATTTQGRTILPAAGSLRRNTLSRGTSASPQTSLQANNNGPRLGKT